MSALKSAFAFVVAAVLLLCFAPWLRDDTDEDERASK